MDKVQVLDINFAGTNFAYLPVLSKVMGGQLDGLIPFWQPANCTSLLI